MKLFKNIFRIVSIILTIMSLVTAGKELFKELTEE